MFRGGNWTSSSDYTPLRPRPVVFTTETKRSRVVPAGGGRRGATGAFHCPPGEIFSRIRRGAGGKWVDNFFYRGATKSRRD